MLICHCNGITDRTIRETVRSGARTVAQVVRSCGASSCCGGCARAVAELVEEEAQTRPLPVVVGRYASPALREIPGEPTPSLPLAAE